MADDKASQGMEVLNLILKNRVAAFAVWVASGSFLLGWQYAPAWMQARHLEFVSGWNWIPFAVFVGCSVLVAVSVLRGLFLGSVIGGVWINRLLKQRKPLTDLEHLLLEACIKGNGHVGLNQIPIELPQVVLHEAADSLRERGLLSEAAYSSTFIVLSAAGRKYVTKRMLWAQAPESGR